MKHHALSDADIEAVSLVTKGANRKIIFLKKEHPPESEIIEMPGARPVIKAADWSRFYCVVAEPGAAEDPGVLAKDQSIPDVWASEEEILKAQASFVRNGGLINKLHESLTPYGTLVENAIALADFHVNGETIRKGSWYIAVEPTDEGKEKIDAGEFTGVSIQGTATRTLMEKAEQFTKPGVANVSPADLKRLGPLLAHYAKMAHPFTSCKRDQLKHGLSEDHANRRCAVLKQLIRGKVGKWQVAKGAAGGDAPWSEDVGLALDRVEVQAQMLKCDIGDFADLFAEEVAKAGRFDEQKHPRKGGKFAPKGSATVASRGGGKPAHTAAGATPQDQARANRLHTASNILGSIGYKGQKLGDALRDFQKKNNLPQTGEADPQTMVALRSKMAGRRTKQRAAQGRRPQKRSPEKLKAKRSRMKMKKAAAFNPGDHPRDPIGRFRRVIEQLKVGETARVQGTDITVSRVKPSDGKPGRPQLEIKGGNSIPARTLEPRTAANSAISRAGVKLNHKGEIVGGKGGKQKPVNFKAKATEKQRTQILDLLTELGQKIPPGVQHTYRDRISHGSSTPLPKVQADEMIGYLTDKKRKLIQKSGDSPVWAVVGDG